MPLTIYWAFLAAWIYGAQMGCSNRADTSREGGMPSHGGSGGESGYLAGSDATAPADARPEAARSDASGALDAGPGSDGAHVLDALAATDSAVNPEAGSPAKCPPLSAYGFVKEIVLQDIPAEASGVAWNRDSGSFFVVANLQGKIWEYDEDFKTLLRTITLENMNMDTEGIEYLEDGWIAISEESNYVYVARVSDGVTTISGSNTDQVQVYQPCGPPPVANAGLEGVAYRRPRNGQKGRIFTCQEHLPMRVLQFDYSPSSPPFEQKSALNGTLEVEEPWNAEQVLAASVTDLAGMTYDETSDTLLIVSQESSRVIRVNPQTGAVTESLEMVNTTTSEGIALFDGCQLAIVSEPNRVQIYSP